MGEGDDPTTVTSSLISFMKRRRSSQSGDARNSTFVTLPLRMSCCPVAKMGSISLEVAIKVPKPEDTPETVSSTHVEVIRNDDAGSDLHASESIEMGPITRLIDKFTGGCECD